MLHRLSISARIRTMFLVLARGPRSRILRAATAVVGGISLAASALAVPVLVGSERPTESFTLQVPEEIETDEESSSTPGSSAVVRAPKASTAPKAPSSDEPATQPARNVAGTGGPRSALLIGIDSPRGSTPLEGAVTDVENVYKALRVYGWDDSEITMLTEEQATIGRIRSELNAFAARSNPNGLAVFAWAGHSGRGRNGNTFATYNGERFAASELSRSLAQVRSKMWVILPTCYSGGYSTPGITGPGRVAVFSSSADEQTWEMGSAGTHVIIYMVKYAMVEGRADGSVEEAFAYAHKTLSEERPDRVPAMNDQVRGDLVLAVADDKPQAKQPAPSDQPSQPEEKPAPKPEKKKEQQQPSPSPTPKEEEEDDSSVFCGVLGC